MQHLMRLSVVCSPWFGNAGGHILSICRTSRISLLLLSPVFDRIHSGRNEKPTRPVLSLSSAKPPMITTSPSETDNDVRTSRLVSVGELLTPVCVTTKLESCCCTVKSTTASRTMGDRSKMTPELRYSTDCTGALPLPG